MASNRKEEINEKEAKEDEQAAIAYVEEEFHKNLGNLSGMFAFTNSRQLEFKNQNSYAKVNEELKLEQNKDKWIVVGSESGFKKEKENSWEMQVVLKLKDEPGKRDRLVFSIPEHIVQQKKAQLQSASTRESTQEKSIQQSTGNIYRAMAAPGTEKDILKKVVLDSEKNKSEEVEASKPLSSKERLKQIETIAKEQQELLLQGKEPQEMLK